MGLPYPGLTDTVEALAREAHLNRWLFNAKYNYGVEPVVLKIPYYQNGWWWAEVRIWKRTAKLRYRTRVSGWGRMPGWWLEEIDGEATTG